MPLVSTPMGRHNMAEARRETVPPPPPVEEKVILELTPDEAMVVAKVLSHVGGSQYGPRCLAEGVLLTLERDAEIGWYDNWPNKWGIKGTVTLNNA